MHLQVDCNRPLRDIYGETMELVKVRLCVSNGILLLTPNSASSLRSAARGRLMRLYSKLKNLRLDG